MSTSADRLPRLLALVPYLLARPGVRVAEAAADFGVPEGQLRRDLQLLWMCGLPGHGPGDLIDLSFEGDTITVGFDAGMSRPLRLTGDEALALVVALRTLADDPDLTDRGAVERALAKVEGAAGDAAEVAGAIAVRVEPSDRVLAQVRGALDGGRAIHLRYYVSARDETTERTVDPVRLRWVDDRWYLEAWCRSAEGVRFFRLDRVDALEVLDEPSRPPADLQERDLSGGIYQPAPDHPLITLRLGPPGRWAASYYPCERVTELADGWLEVTLRAADPTWVRRLVFGLGVHAEVVGPSWFAESVRAEARAALDAYAAVPAGRGVS
jgi:proteasome accessory factor C